jgi:hypothetical protein
VKALIGLGEGTSGLLRVQALEEGGLRLESHRNYFDQTYKAGAPQDVANGLEQELGVINGMAQRSPEMDGMSGHGLRGVPTRGQASSGTAPAGGGAAPAAGAAAAGPGAGAYSNLSMSPSQLQNTIARFDAGTQRVLGALMTSGDPNMGTAGARLATSYVNGLIGRQALMAGLSSLQSGTPALYGEPRYGGADQDQGQRAAPQVSEGEQQPSECAAPSGDTEAAVPQPKYVTEPPTTEIVTPGAVTAQAPSAQRPTPPVQFTDTGQPREAEHPAPPPAPAPREPRVAQGERPGAPLPEDIARGLIPPNNAAARANPIAYAQSLRARAAFLYQKGSLLNLAGRGAGAGFIAQANSDIKQAEGIESAIKQGGEDIFRMRTTGKTRLRPTGAEETVPEYDVLYPKQGAGAGAPGAGAAGTNQAVKGDFIPTGPSTEGILKPKEQQMEQYQNDIEQAQHNLYTIPSQIQRLEDIQRLGAKYEAGKWNDVKAQAVAAARAFGFNPRGLGPTWDPGSYQEWMKDMIQGVYDEVNKLKGRVLTKEISGWEEALANPNMQAPAARHLTATMIAGLQQQINYSRGLADYGYQFGNRYPMTSHIGYDNNFFGPNYQQRLQAGIDREENEHPFKGDVPITSSGKFDKQNAVTNRIYLMPMQDGKHVPYRWDGKTLNRVQ